MPYGTLSDVATEFGPIADADIEKAETKLEQAEELIDQALRRNGRTLAGDVATGAVSVGVIKLIEAEMVAEVLRNPTGASSTYSTEMVGPFQRSQQASYSSGGNTRWANRDLPGTSPGVLHVTERHLQMLRVAVSGAFTVRARAPHGHGPAWGGGLWH